LLTGAGSLTKVDGINGALMIVVNVEPFSAVSDFKSAADGLVRELRTSPKADGNAEILVPGEVEFREYRLRSEQGIPIDEHTWSEIVGIATELDIGRDVADLKS
jgi:LDH2 family malate/lactate/ureidoglycolate dehydrogenase